MKKLGFLVLILMAITMLGRRASAANWYDGAPSRVQHICNNWVAQTSEDLIWTWVGFQDIDVGGSTRLPQTGETYYVRVMIGSLGCSGAWVRPELKLPKGTSLAISSSAPVRCFVDKGQGPVALSASDCPASPSTGLFPNASLSGPNPPNSSVSNEFYGFPPSSQPYWPLPTGSILYIEVPVKSAAALSGIASNDYLVAAVNVIDNNPGGGNPPWDGHEPGWAGSPIPSSGPWQGVFVTSVGGARSPYVGYSNTNLVVGTTTATTDATIYNYDCVASGTLHAEMFPVVGPQTSATGTASCVAGCCTAGCTQSYATFRHSWVQLTPDTDYKWRAYLFNLQVNAGCVTTLADAQVNASTPQWAYLHTKPTNPPGPSFGLMLHASAGGSLSADPLPVQGSTRYAPGTAVTITATPDNGFMLQSLTQNGTPVSAPLSITMDQDQAIDAIFAAGSDAGADASTDSGGGGGCNESGGAPSPGWLALAVGALLITRRRRRRGRRRAGSRTRRHRRSPAS